MVIEQGKITESQVMFPGLIKFEFTTLDGRHIRSSQNRYPGSHATAKSKGGVNGYPHTNQKAFNERVLSEQNLPEDQRSTCEISETENNYRNIYVVSAKTISQSQPQQRSEEPSGGTSWPSPATGNSWTSALDSTGKSIIRQVAFKGARKTVYEAHVQAVLVESILKEIKNAIASAESQNEDHVPVSELRDIYRISFERDPEGVVSPHLLTPDVAKLTNDYESIILGTYSDDEDKLEGEEI